MSSRLIRERNSEWNIFLFFWLAVNSNQSSPSILLSYEGKNDEDYVKYICAYDLKLFFQVLILVLERCRFPQLPPFEFVHQRILG